MVAVVGVEERKRIFVFSGNEKRATSPPLCCDMCNLLLSRSAFSPMLISLPLRHRSRSQRWSGSGDGWRRNAAWQGRRSEEEEKEAWASRSTTKESSSSI